MAKILLVEDDAILVEMYQAKFELEGHDVRIATNGEECLTVLKDYEPELILLDILMPKLNGFHVLKEIKRTNVMSAGVELAQSTSSGSFLNDEMGKKVSQVAYDKLFTTGLSRSDELEADAVGVQLAGAAGYRAHEMPDQRCRNPRIEHNRHRRTVQLYRPQPPHRAPSRPRGELDPSAHLKRREGGQSFFLPAAGLRGSAGSG